MKEHPVVKAHLVVRSALLLAVIAAASGCAHGRGVSGPTGTVVEAVGWAAVESGDRLGARRRALVDAQREAVERVTGVVIEARTEVRDAVTVVSRIEAALKGRILSYEVLEEGTEKGLLKTRIRAVVAEGDAGRRVAVIIEDPAARQAVGRALEKAGYTLVEDPRDPADVEVTGEALSFALPGPRPWGFHSHRARVSLKAVRRRSGEVALLRREASALGVAAELAGEKARERAGELAGEALGKQLSTNGVRP